MFVQASAPPPAVAPAPPAPVMQLATVTQRALPLTLTKAGRVERAVVRQQVFMKISVRPGATATVEGQAVTPTPCAWTIETYLQREICFSSMTGQTSCTDPVSTLLAAGEAGQADLTGQSCDVMAEPVTQSARRVRAGIEPMSTAVFEDDYKVKVRPLLTAGGVILSDPSAKPPPKPASSRKSGS
ncbi:hypothetical protein [Caulobacter hibisci]|uniref:Uncharacterized protein n=1 Tax=Caulobacter hibisci TaxID=2035993 RepID=A0ABS0T088_9CAUL|nr:hypothetical protein [Caulobacter hibisci]MBI1685293.1 hypothetical protein [Caulobacter hibisci]